MKTIILITAIIGVFYWAQQVKAGVEAMQNARIERLNKI